MKAHVLMVSLLAFGLATPVWAEEAAKAAEAAPVADTAAKTSSVKDEPIKPIEAAVVKDPKMVELGKKLYFDPRLS